MPSGKLVLNKIEKHGAPQPAWLPITTSKWTNLHLEVSYMGVPGTPIVGWSIMENQKI
jgi:hypothetical protein